jgi:dipeptide/tripeptide permease
MITIKPYVTRVLAGGGAFGVRFSLYVGIQVITIVTFVLMRRHVRSHELVRAGAIVSVAEDIGFLLEAAALAVSIPIGLVSQSQWAYLVWVAAGFAGRAYGRLRDPLGHGR